jgi:putative transcriptional regulator
MTTIIQHADPATLLAFAAGTLPEALSAVVAAHVAMCPSCRAEVADMELMGAALLTGSPMAASSGERVPVPARPRCAPPGLIARHRPADPLPSPISTAYGLTLDTVPWRRLGPGVWHHRLALSAGSEGDLRLLRIAAGQQMPEHGHGGTELTLVIAGAYSDETGNYRRGDIQDIDEETEHRPLADRDEGCICLIASERRARFKGLVGRLVGPLTGM